MHTTSFLFTETIDPIEANRLKSGRPATRHEIHQRHMRASRGYTAQLMQPSDIRASDRTASRAASASSVFDTIRRSVSRALTMAADRIAPEAT